MSLLRLMRSKLRYKPILAIVGFAVLLDVSVGQIAKRAVPPRDRHALLERERAYRVRSPIYHHDLKPNIVANGGWGPRRHPVYTNSLGFKAARVEEVPLRGGKPRLLFIGDSFTEGIGVEYPRTFVGRVARALEDRKIDVLNAAVASYSPVIYYRKLKYWIEERGLKLDHVIVLVDVSDVEDEARYYELKDDRVVDRPDSPIHASPTMDTIDTVPPRSFKEELILNSLLLRTAFAFRAALFPPQLPRFARLRLGYAGGRPRGTWTYDDASYESFGRLGTELVKRHLGMLLNLLRRHDVSFTVGAYPWPDQIVERDHGERHALMLMRWAEENSVPFIDLYPLFVNSEPALTVLRRYYIPGDIHFNEAGHERVAQAIVEWLRGRL